MNSSFLHKSNKYLAKNSESTLLELWKLTKRIQQKGRHLVKNIEKKTQPPKDKDKNKPNN